MNYTEAEQGELAAEGEALAHHQAAIDAIHAKQAERQRTVDLRTLEERRSELRERRTFYEERLPVFRTQTEDYENKRNHIRDAYEAVARTNGMRPPIASLLPNDPDAVRWQKAYDAENAKLAKLQAEFQALPNPDLLQRELIDVHAHINRLEYEVSNLMRKLEGRSGKSWLEGGPEVSGVGPGGVFTGEGKAWA